MQEVIKPQGDQRDALTAEQRRRERRGEGAKRVSER